MVKNGNFFVILHLILQTKRKIMTIQPLASLFPITDPTWIFFVVLCIILFAPILLNRLHIPHIVGMLLAGVLVGPHGLDLLQRDSSFEIFGNVGLLYIMFLAGVEIDLADFNKHKQRGIIFGLFTFLFPFALGCLLCHTILHMDWPASLLVASMFSSHTLVSYAIASRFGVTRNLSVNMAVGGTIITDTLSLLVLAVVSRMVGGENTLHFWVVLFLGMILFTGMVLYFYPRIARYFFRNYNDQILQFIFVMAMLFLAAIGAEIAGMEGILGAFLAGLVLNRLIPAGSPLMGRIEFLGNALFIPYFLIGVGMLIDVSSFFRSTEALILAGLMTLFVTAGKYVAAWLAQQVFKMSKAQGLMLFGLSEAHTAGTLAVAMVGYELGLFDRNILNCTLTLILFTCIISSFAVEHASKKLALSDDLSTTYDQNEDDEKILIPMVNYNNVEQLMQVALLMRNPILNRGLIGLNVQYDTHSKSVIEEGRKCLQYAEKIAVSANVRMQVQSRLATNLSNGIIHALRENDASEIILGFHQRKSSNESFFGPVTLGLLSGMSRQIILVRCTIPANTIRRIHVVIPAKGEFEAGFFRWVDRLARMGTTLGCRVHFHAHPHTWSVLERYLSEFHSGLRTAFEKTSGHSHNELKMLTEQINSDHLLVIVSARKDSVSYHPSFEHIPEIIDQCYADISLMMIYPDQFDEERSMLTMFDSRVTQEYKGYEAKTGWLSKIVQRFTHKKHG